MSEVNKNLGHATAYGYAKSQGYAGTEEEFAALMAGYADVGQRAETAATAAAESAAAAKASENAAKTSETIAASAALTATTASQNASESATAASASATAASASAVTASSAATAASGSASTASAKASEASGSATAASASAAAASVSASSASASASSAAVSASSAESAAASLVIDPTLSHADQAADAKVTGDEISALKSQIETKANKDGTYPNMTVGNAEQLVATVGIEDKVPYLFRTSGGSVDIGDREEDMLVGGTVAWNQLVENGNFANSNKWVATQGSFTIANNEATVTTTRTYGQISHPSITFISGHKYLFMCSAKSSDGLKVSIGASAMAVGHHYHQLSASYTDIGQIGVCANPVGNTMVTIASNNGGDDKVFVAKNAMCIDLTQMFGSTIADYIYSLETTTPGSGVAWFRKLFPAPYYAYDAGTLKSVEATSHDMVGFNAWDGETESGYIYNGIYYSSNDYWRTKNFIPVVGGASYYFKVTTGGQITCYDAEKTYITSIADFGIPSHIATMPSNCAYIKFYQSVATDKNTVCVNLSWDGERNGEYEQYVKHSYPLDDSLTLRGIPKLDADNKLYYDGDTYESNGTVTRKYGIVDMGTLTWTYASTPQKFNSTGLNSLIKKPATSGTLPSIITSGGYTVLTPVAYNNATGYKNITIDESNGSIGMHDPSYTDADLDNGHASWLNGVYLVYELATPTTESADPYQSTQVVDDFGTEEYVSNTVVPVGHVTQYMANLRAKLEMAPDSPSGNGDYIVRQTDGNNEYVPLVIPTELPSNPSTDGTYTLKVTVASGTPTLAWVADS